MRRENACDLGPVLLGPRRTLADGVEDPAIAPASSG